MAGGTVISGLASGLDTATIINQLMSLESAPQTRLKSRVSTEQVQVGSLQTLNAKLASLTTRATAAADPTKWGTLRTTSTSDRVSASADATAMPASLALTVNATAATHQLGFTDSAVLADVVTGASTQVRLDLLDGTTKVVETGDGTLRGLVDALNDPANATGVRANLVRTGDGGYRLMVESTTTGESSDFALSALDGSALLGGATVRAGRDAEVALGAGIVATSATNTFTDLLPGVDVTLAAGTAVGTTTELTVSRDAPAATKLVKDLVDGLNAALSEMRGLTSYGTNGAAKGLLAGDATVRTVQTQLQGTLFGADGVSLASLGIQVDRSGTFTFDEAAFTKAYAADPGAVATTLSTGFATRVREVADGASNTTDGVLTSAITGRKAGIERLNDSIEAWDARLELRRTALTRQFTALETALSRMSSQSNWLAGQISSLPSAG